MSKYFILHETRCFVFDLILCLNLFTGLWSFKKQYISFIICMVHVILNISTLALNTCWTQTDEAASLLMYETVYEMYELSKTRSLIFDLPEHGIKYWESLGLNNIAQIYPSKTKFSCHPFKAIKCLGGETNMSHYCVNTDTRLLVHVSLL